MKYLQRIASASWYVPTHSFTFENKIHPYMTDHMYFGNADFNKTLKQNIKNNLEEAKKEYNVSEDVLLSDAFIDKIVKGLEVSDCYDTISDISKDARGFRDRSSMDESSYEAFMKDYHKKLKRYSDDIDAEEDRITEAKQEVIKNYKEKADNFEATTEGIRQLAKYKDYLKHSLYFDDNSEPLVYVTKKLNDNIKKKWDNENKDYTLEDIEQFVDGYKFHINDDFLKIINKRKQELENGETNEEEPLYQPSDKEKTANAKIFEGFGIGKNGEMYFVQGFQDADARAKIKAAGGKFNGAVKQWYFGFPVEGFGELVEVSAFDIFDTYPGRYGNRSYKLNLNAPLPEAANLAKQLKFTAEQKKKIDEQTEDFEVGDTIDLPVECVKKYEFREGTYVMTFNDDAEHEFVAFMPASRKFCQSVEQGDTFTLSAVVDNISKSNYNGKLQYRLKNPKRN